MFFFVKTFSFYYHIFFICIHSANFNITREFMVEVDFSINYDILWERRNIMVSFKNLLLLIYLFIYLFIHVL